jgi:glutaredoxin 3
VAKAKYRKKISSLQTKKNMKFTVYSRSGCPFCSKIEQVLNLSNLDYKVYRLDEDFTRDQFYSEFGVGSTFPQVLLNDTEHLGGCTDTVKYLQENKVI